MEETNKGKGDKLRYDGKGGEVKSWSERYSDVIRTRKMFFIYEI